MVPLCSKIDFGWELYTSNRTLDANNYRNMTTARSSAFLGKRNFELLQPERKWTRNSSLMTFKRKCGLSKNEWVFRLLHVANVLVIGNSEKKLLIQLGKLGTSCSERVGS